MAGAAQYNTADITTDWKWFNAGSNRALLSGTGRDMDLFLNKWSFFEGIWQWVIVGKSEGFYNNEVIKFDQAGYYSVTIVHWCCESTYDLCVRGNA